MEDTVRAKIHAIDATMQIESLELFVEVANRGSFAEVARLHEKDASSVSRAISTLEGKLGVRLFQRTTRRVSLTEAGRVFLDRAAPLIEGLAMAQDEARAMSSAPQGNLRLTTSVSLGQQCVVPLLPRFRELFPKISIELLLTDANLDLVAERIDLAIRLGQRPGADYISARLLDTRYRVCASPAYLKSCAPLRHPEDLEKHSCLLQLLPRLADKWRFTSKLGDIEERGEKTIGVTGDIVISNAVALRDACSAGLGPALLVDWLIREQIESGELADVFPYHRVAPADFNPGVWLVYPSRTFLAQKVRVTADFFKKHLGRKQQEG